MKADANTGVEEDWSVNNLIQSKILAIEIFIWMNIDSKMVFKNRGDVAAFIVGPVQNKLL